MSLMQKTLWSPVWLYIGFGIHAWNYSLILLCFDEWLEVADVLQIPLVLEKHSEHVCNISNKGYVWKKVAFDLGTYCKYSQLQWCVWGQVWWILAMSSRPWSQCHVLSETWTSSWWFIVCACMSTSYDICTTKPHWPFILWTYYNFKEFVLFFNLCE